MKFITLAVAALIGASAHKITTGAPKISGITGTNTGPAPGLPNGVRKMPPMPLGPLAKKLPDPAAAPCNAPFGTDLYVPYEYRPECLKPPLLPNIEACPIDDKKMLSDGKTLAIPYPKGAFNCNPFGIFGQVSAPNSRVAFAQGSKNESKNEAAKKA